MRVASDALTDQTSGRGKRWWRGMNPVWCAVSCTVEVGHPFRNFPSRTIEDDTDQGARARAAGIGCALRASRSTFR